MITINSYLNLIDEYDRSRKIYLNGHPFDTFLIHTVPIRGYISNQYGAYETKIKNTHKSNYYLSII